MRLLSRPPSFNPARASRLVLDLFSGQGGAAAGYSMAGFTVIGVDNDPRALKHYPFPSYCMSWIEGLGRFGAMADVIHASPPCQNYSQAVIDKNPHPDLIPVVQEALYSTGKPYIIENVPGSPLKNPIELCGCMFDLTIKLEQKEFALYRERLFETSFSAPRMQHKEHVLPACPVMGNGSPGWFYKRHGHGTSAGQRSDLMHTSWMTQHGTSEAIPPAFTGYLARWLDTVVLSA